MKYVFITYDGIGFPIAKKLIDEGNEVTVAQVQDISELHLEEATGEKCTEKPEDKKVRLQLYDNVFPKQPASKVVPALEKIQNKDDYWIIFDFNNLFHYGEMALKMGFKNIFAPTKEQFLLERDRKAGKDIAKKYYTKLKVAEVEEFKTIDEAIDFLEDTTDVWALKSNSDHGETFVPTMNDPEQAKAFIIDKLNEQKKDYESEGFILERKIKDIKEFTPEGMWFNGQLVSTAVDIEYKHIGAGANGEQVGCGNNLVIKTAHDEEVNKMAFPPYIHEQAKKHKGLFVFDASILYSEQENAYYFGEFCANRWGWDSFFSELAMCKSVSDYFEKIALGEDPIQSKFGVSIRGFNVHKKEDALMLFEDDKNLWIYDCYKKNDDYRTTGMGKDLVVATGASDDPIKATDMAYEALESFGFNKMMFRPKFDFLTTQFESSIVNRYRAINHDLMEAHDIIPLHEPLASIEGYLSKIVQNMEVNEGQNAIMKKKHSEAIASSAKKMEQMKRDHQAEIKKIKEAIKKTLYE